VIFAPVLEYFADVVCVHISAEAHIVLEQKDMNKKEVKSALYIDLMAE